MESVLFTRQELTQIEESILRTTNINVRSVLKRARHAGVLKQMCYLIGCEIINITNVLEPNLSFGVLEPCSDSDTTRADLTMNRSTMLNHVSMLESSRYHGNGTQPQPMLKFMNQLLMVKQKINISLTKVLQKKIDSFLYSSSKFVRYSKDNLTRDRLLSRLTQIEVMTMEHAEAENLASSAEEELLSDLGHIYNNRGMIKQNAVQTHIDMDRLEADFKQANKDMMYLITRKCSKRSVQLFETLHQAAAQEHPDDRYISAQLLISGKTVLPYLQQVDVIEHHPNNDKLVKLIDA